jgi:hypothetical protein
MYPSYPGPVAAAVGGTGTSAKIFALKNNSAVAAAIQLPSGGELEGQQFIVRASGKLFVHGTTPTINFLLQNGSSLTSGSNTTISTGTSAQGLTTGATYPFAFEGRLQGDSTSGIVQVTSATFYVNGTSVSLTNTALTGINLSSGLNPSGTPPNNNNVGPSLSLLFAITFGVSDALNSATLEQWQVEQ